MDIWLSLLLVCHACSCSTLVEISWYCVASLNTGLLLYHSCPATFLRQFYIIYVTLLFQQILNTYRSFVTDSEKEGISCNLQQTEEWLYEDGDDESESVYTERLQDLERVC